MWAGTGWIGNLRRGVRAEWEPDFDMVNDNRGFFWSKLEDALTFFGLLITLGLTIATSQFGSLAAEWIAGVTHLGSIRGHEVFMILAAIVASTIAGWILFMFLFTALPKGRRNWPAIMRGSLVAGFLFGLLQIGAGYLVKAFSSNRAVQAFGSVIIIMLVFNLMARLILLISAWTATSNQPAVAWEWNDCDQPLVGDPEVWTVPGTGTQHSSVALRNSRRSDCVRRPSRGGRSLSQPPRRSPDPPCTPTYAWSPVNQDWRRPCV